ncbi:MAG: leucine-rich repeat protein [Firmicutes bacterium]|nr:leucine-rich repeat protein [Bacillota bacterium]
MFITSCEINEKTKVIYDSAFYNCGSLTSITIPNSVTSIERSAFSGCSSLREVNYKGTEEQWNKISIDRGNNYLKTATINYIK